MATITAAAGGGNWTTGATWVGGVAPTSADDAVLNGTSGAVTVNAGAVARSLDCTGYTGTLTHTAAVTLTLGDGTAGAGNIALKLVSGMTYTLGSTSTSAISFVSTSATTQTIAAGGRTLGSWTINGVGSSYQLTSGVTIGSTATMTLTNGTLDTNGQTCIWGTFSSNNSNTRTLTLGASSLTLTGSSVASWSCATATNFTLNAGTSTITLSGNAAQFNSGSGLSYNTVALTGPGVASLNIASGTTFANLTRTGTAVKTDALWINNSATVSGTLTFNGNSATNRLLVQATTIGTAVTLTCNGTVTGSNVDIMDITAAGSASWDLSAFTGGSGDCRGNTGITFTTGVPQTHTTAAGGNWSDVSVWTSRVPLPQDDVTVDVNTTGTLTADMPRLGRSIDFTGFAGTASFASVANTMYGSWTSGSGMTISGTQILTIAGRSTFTITSAGKTFTQAVTITNPTGTYTLQDAFVTNGAFTFSHGTLTTGGQAVTSTTFTQTGASAVYNMGASTITLTGTAAGGIFTRGSGVFNGGTATIVIANVSANSRTVQTSTGMSGATLTYTLAGSTGALVLAQASSWSTINFSDATNARTLTLPASATTTVTNFNVSGGSGRVVTLNSSSSGTTATLSKSSGVVNSDYLSIQDSTATGGASWYAGTHSTKGSNVVGWFFTAPNFGSFLQFM
jgi:hypothetical protein